MNSTCSVDAPIIYTRGYGRGLEFRSLGDARGDAMIRFGGVHKGFGELHVLTHIHLTVTPREGVVVCGPSGSGKSTLIRTINDLEPINEGKLSVDGMDLSDPKMNINRLRAHIGSF